MQDFDSIFKKYHSILFLYAQKFVQNEDIALDIVQDVFAKIWERNKHKLKEEHLKAYLFNSVRNTCFNHIKHQKIVQKHQLDKLQDITELEIQHYQSVEKSLIEKENLEKIYQAINDLSDIYKEVIELSRFEGLKNKEIAIQLGIPVRTVETRLFRALSLLREKISKKSFHILLNFYQLKS